MIRYEVRGGGAFVTLDSPHNRNALSSALVEGLRAALIRAEDDKAVRAVVLGHTGGTFCAGADLGEAAEQQGTPAEQAADRTRVFLDLLRMIASHGKPVVAVVDGHVRAGGMGLVAACDLALAGPSSSFALTEVRLGLAAAMISVPLAHRVEPRSLQRYLLTGERFDAGEAERIGLVTRSVSDLPSAVDEVLADFRTCSPQGLRENKHLLADPLLRDLSSRGEELAATSARLFGTPEALEGLTAFLERRPPSWAAGPGVE